jgi:hypothetical protein
VELPNPPSSGEAVGFRLEGSGWRISSDVRFAPFGFGVRGFEPPNVEPVTDEPSYPGESAPRHSSLQE